MLATGITECPEERIKLSIEEGGKIYILSFNKNNYVFPPRDQAIQVASVSFSIYGLNQTLTTGCKLAKHFLTWSRGMYPVYSFSFCIPEGAFSV